MRLGVLICMRTDQSGTRGQDFYLYKSVPLPSQWSINTVFSPLELHRAQQTCMVQSKAELSTLERGLAPGCLTPGPINSPATFTITLYHHWALCSEWRLFTTPQIGDSRWCFLLVLTWCQWPAVDTALLFSTWSNSYQEGRIKIYNYNCWFIYLSIILSITSLHNLSLWGNDIGLILIITIFHLTTNSRHMIFYISIT